MRHWALIASVALGWLAIGESGAAADIAGTRWLNPRGTVVVAFEPCHDAVCGTVVWIKPGAHAAVGQRVVYDMKSVKTDEWTGKGVFDGQTFDGTMTRVGDRLTVSGCLLGGLLCKSTLWTRNP